MDECVFEIGLAQQTTWELYKCLCMPSVMCQSIVTEIDVDPISIEIGLVVDILAYVWICG